eukprot:COSAG02_NODE_5601_length_4197_cov_2.005857_1_plen_64_part_00
MTHGWWRREKRGGEIGGGTKGNRRRITKKSDWRRKEVKKRVECMLFLTIVEWERRDRGIGGLA